MSLVNIWLTFNCVLETFHYFVVPDPTVKIFPPSPIQGAVVGRTQAFDCIVSTVSGVELSSIVISWIGPDGNLTTDNDRIIIHPITASGNNYTSSLYFIYLMEADEGLYTCNVKILENIQTSTIEMNNFTCEYMYVDTYTPCTNLVFKIRHNYFLLVIIIIIRT